MKKRIESIYCVPWILGEVTGKKEGIFQYLPNKSYRATEILRLLRKFSFKVKPLFASKIAVKLSNCSGWDKREVYVLIGFYTHKAKEYHTALLQDGRLFDNFHPAGVTANRARFAVTNIWKLNK